MGNWGHWVLVVDGEMPEKVLYWRALGLVGANLSDVLVFFFGVVMTIIATAACQSL